MPSIKEEWSHPIRDAWIEINISSQQKKKSSGRIPYGMRGLKCVVQGYGKLEISRIPYGMRGLKYRRGDRFRAGR